MLTDNGAVYNAFSRKSRSEFESLPEDFDVTYQHGRLYHPQTQGKMLHLNVGYRHRRQRILWHIIDERVRVLSEDYKLIGEATLDPRQSY